MKALLTGLIATLTIGTSAHAENPTAGLPAEVVAKHTAMTAGGTCVDETPFGPETYELGAGKKLYLIPCYFGAYQGSLRGYVTSEGDTEILPVMILSYSEVAKGIVANLDLSGATYDVKTKTLSTEAKSRGLGDCGVQTTSLITVDQDDFLVVKTTEVRFKANCDGKVTAWPVVFKQK